ncbi:MAG: iron chaperone [Gaiellaceae bacterium]
MAESKTAKKRTQKSKGFSAEERAAMRERAQELKAEADKADGEKALLAKVAEMPEADRTLAERLHAIVKENAPELSPKTWYGMPAYAKDGKVVCFFRNASKFKERYAMFGFNDTANLDDGSMWPIAYALTELTAADEKKIAALVKKAVS